MRTFNIPFATGRPRRHAFSRVELVVVLTIVAVLSALLGPGLLTVREAARRTQLRSELHKLGIRIRDHEGATDRNLPSFVTMYATAPSADSPDVRLFFDVAIAVAVCVAAAAAGLVIRFSVRFFNRRGRDSTRGNPENEDTSWRLDRWFCPPSSAPL